MAGQISYAGNGIASHNLIVSPKATGGTSAQWKTSDTASVDTGNWETGYENSVALYTAGHTAAIFCRNLTIGGYTDWYLPAMNELEILFFNLKPGGAGNTGANNAAANAYAVPSRAGTNYGGYSNPSQTTAVIFQSGGEQELVAMANWSSNNSGTTWGRYIQMSDGFAWGAGKSNSFPIRAIRKVAVGTAP